MKKLLFIFALISSPAMAQNLDSSHGDWNVYKNGDECYMATLPIKEDGNFAKRGQAYALINFQQGRADEVNVSSGYPYKKNTDVELRVKGSKFKLFSEGETAWAKNAKDDKKILSAMKIGDEMVVKGVSQKGTYSTDTYSLKGITAAYKKMKELCK